MRIKSLRGFHVGFNPEPALGNAQTFIRRRDFLLIAITTECGKTGWGEVFNSPFAAASFIKAKLAPVVIGQNALERHAIFERMRALLAYDKRGAARQAMSGIDMAVHDVAAQILDLPMVTLLGGAAGKQVSAYASGPFIVEGQGYGNYQTEIEGYLQKGFKAVKPRAGLNPAADGKMVDAIRKSFGDELGLMVDVNQGYALAGATESLRRMEGAGLMWVEEPLQPEDIPGYRRLAATVRVPLAGGEALATPAAFRDFLEADTFSVLQPDLTVCGGFSGYRQISGLGMAYDLPTIPHSFGTVVNAFAALHAAAVEPLRRGGGPSDYPLIEYDMTANPLLALRSMPVNENGTITIGDAPGLGLDLNPDELSPWMTDSWEIKD